MGDWKDRKEWKTWGDKRKWDEWDEWESKDWKGHDKSDSKKWKGKQEFDDHMPVTPPEVSSSAPLTPLGPVKPAEPLDPPQAAPGTPWHRLPVTERIFDPKRPHQSVPGTPAAAFIKQPSTPGLPVPSTPSHLFPSTNAAPVSTTPGSKVAGAKPPTLLENTPLDPLKMLANILDELKRRNPKASKEAEAEFRPMLQRAPVASKTPIPSVPRTPTGTVPHTPAMPVTPTATAPQTPMAGPRTPTAATMAPQTPMGAMPGTPGALPGTPGGALMAKRLMLPSAAQMRSWGLQLRQFKSERGSTEAMWDIPEDVPAWMQECERMYQGVTADQLRWAQPTRTKKDRKKPVPARVIPQTKKADLNHPNEVWRKAFPSFEEYQRRKKLGLPLTGERDGGGDTPVPLQPGDATPGSFGGDAFVALAMTPGLSGETTPLLDNFYAGDLFGMSLPATPKG
ncbi:unnamed protein product [Durusdinium trenchii]|uniref:Ig-like domain-containing protein n=2 Tax=Durusdinium trenchii TaxID=1381693 RepID=A0ABP0LQY8_9DINO